MELVDEQWQHAARENSKKGFSFAVWGKKGERPMVLLDSKRTPEDAERFAETERATLRPKCSWTVIVTTE